VLRREAETFPASQASHRGADCLPLRIDGVGPPVKLGARRVVPLANVLVDRIEDFQETAVVGPDIYRDRVPRSRSPSGPDRTDAI
jgi:hypothetical protein